jgi:hypothetical protein
VTRWLWQAPDGSVTDLSAWGAGNHVVDDGTVGILAPEYEFTSEGFAGLDGELLQNVTAGPGQPSLALDLTATDPVEFRSRLRGLAHALRPRAGIGALSAVADDGSTRTLPCYYRKGLETGTYRATRYRAVIQFWAPSPWWRGDPVTPSWGLAAPTPFFPFPPLVLAASTIVGSVTVDLSDTDAPTFPRWTVTGPGDQLTLRNDSTGAQLVLNQAIGDGQVLVIDTRPGMQSIMLGVPGAHTTDVQRTNLAPNPQAVNTNGWGYLGPPAGWTIALSVLSNLADPGLPAGVTTAYRQTITTGGTGQFGAFFGSVGPSAGAYGMPVTPGVVYTAGMYVRCSQPQTMAPMLAFYDATGNLLQSFTTPDVALPAGVFTRLTVTQLAPAAAVFARLRFYTSPTVTSGMSNGGTFDATAAQLEEGSPIGGYFDGATPSASGATVGDLLHTWTGTPHASPSVESRVTGVGDPVLTTNVFGQLRSDPALWPLVDGVNQVTALLTNAGPASSVALVADRLYSGAL